MKTNRAKRTVLVFSPHPDDAEFAMGGTLLALCKAGALVHVIVVSDGGGVPGTSVAERYAEQQLAAEAGGYQVHCLDIPDGAISATQSNLDLFQRVVLDLAPQVVFAPFPFAEATDYRSSHSDHEGTGLLVREALLRARVPNADGRYWRTGALYYYYLPYGVKPTVAVDVSGVIADLRRLLECFKSQTSRRNRSVEHLVAKRVGTQVGMEGLPAELFAADGPLIAKVEQLFFD